jgi:hypothetical protein
MNVKSLSATDFYDSSASSHDPDPVGSMVEREHRRLVKIKYLHDEAVFFASRPRFACQATGQLRQVERWFPATQHGCPPESTTSLLVLRHATTSPYGLFRA